ncbi:hypothetical protein [Selenomonas noxia]|uniref:hypothetical protein n=1 Tax=Selenomonas noxia TaxID=135083 RepID=UPI0023F3453B|nr:hypothetical protein [Selenomonas noxia]
MKHRITKMEQPTSEQIQRLKALMDELGYDFEDYPIESMSREDAAELIDEMRDELCG